MGYSGADAGNYSVNSTTSGTASINQRTLVVSATGVGRTYDGTTDITVKLKDNRVTGDALTLSYDTAILASKAAGTQSVSVAGINVTGNDVGNYTFNTTATTTAAIAKLVISGSVTISDKVYDGSTRGTIATRSLTGVLPGDVVNLANGAASFSDKNVATGKPVNVTNLGLSGADAGNYSVNSTTSGTASITKRTLLITATAANKKYDGTTTASVTLADNRVTGDQITLSYAAASFA